MLLLGVVEAPREEPHVVDDREQKLEIGFGVRCAQVARRYVETSERLGDVAVLVSDNLQRFGHGEGALRQWALLFELVWTGRGALDENQPPGPGAATRLAAARAAAAPT